MYIDTIFLFIIASIALVISGNWAVKFISRLSSIFKISHFSIGFIIVAFTTSVPELFVGISSAIAKTPSIALGNVIGANILDLTLVIAIASLLGGGMKIQSKTLKRDSILMFLVALAPIVLMVFDENLSRADGIILILIFIYYSWHIMDKRKEYEKTPNYKKYDLIMTILLFFGSMIILFISSRFVVNLGVEIAKLIAIPPIMIGLFLIALGTTLPELVLNIQSVLKKNPDLAAGNSMGSVVCNSSLVLGVTALINPIKNSFQIFFTSTIFLIVICLLFIFFIRRKRGLSVPQSVFLILFYIIFILFEFFFKLKIG